LVKVVAVHDVDSPLFVQRVRVVPVRNQLMQVWSIGGVYRQALTARQINASRRCLLSRSGISPPGTDYSIRHPAEDN